MTRHERLIYYILFITVAAPVEIVLSWSFGIANNDYKALYRPVAQALFYLYAFILSSETLFRVALHRERFITPTVRMFLNLSAWGVVLLFVLHYLVNLFPRVEHGLDVSRTWALQVMALLLAVAGSILSYHVIENGPASQPSASKP